MVAAGLRQAFQQPDPAAARASLCHFADQLHNRWPKLKVFVDDSLDDVLAYMSFPGQHRTKLQSTNPLERMHPPKTAEFRLRRGKVAAWRSTTTRSMRRFSPCCG
jgi:transposase-like protein